MLFNIHETKGIYELTMNSDCAVVVVAVTAAVAFLVLVTLFLLLLFLVITIGILAHMTVSGLCCPSEWN